MSDNDTDVLIKAVDPKGYPIILTSERYYGHILSSDSNHQAHPEFTPEEVKATIENPILIYEGKEPDSDVYLSKSCSQYPRLNLLVAVSTYIDCGDVRTAHLAKDMFDGAKKGGVVKYANYKSVL